MPINPISTTKSKGPLGSYYAVSDYTKVNPEFGSLEDFKNLVDKAHELGMYVILDWFRVILAGIITDWKEDYYLKNKKGEIIDPVDYRTGKSYGWTDVADLNYNNIEMREELQKAMIYWVKETNIDGYRIDQAYAVPQEFAINLKSIKGNKAIIYFSRDRYLSPWGIKLINKFDATYDWPRHHLSKDVAQGKNANDYHKHIEKTLRLYGTDNILINFVSNHDENS